MARQNIDDLLALKKRSGRRRGRFPDANDVRRLREAWARCRDSRELFASLLPARLITLVEVFSRYWVEKLIDHGAPFDERAIELKVNIKYDLPLVRSLHGQKISLGFLISNNVSLSEISAISAVFSILVGTDFFNWLSNTRSRMMLENEPGDGDPIIKDIAGLRRALARLFEIRHILVHEFPATPPFTYAEMGEMLDAVDGFIIAADEGFTQLLYGLYPINQQDMNQKARQESSTAGAELDRLVDDIAKKSESDTIRKVQQEWLAFAEAEANRNAEGFTGGTAYPLFFHVALKALTLDRCRQLQGWLDEMLEEEIDARANL